MGISWSPGVSDFTSKVETAQKLVNYFDVPVDYLVSDKRGVSPMDIYDMLPQFIEYIETEAFGDGIARDLEIYFCTK